MIHPIFNYFLVFAYQKLCSVFTCKNNESLILVNHSTDVPLLPIQDAVRRIHLETFTIKI